MNIQDMTELAREIDFDIRLSIRARLSYDKSVAMAVSAIMRLSHGTANPEIIRSIVLMHKQPFIDAGYTDIPL